MCGPAPTFPVSDPVVAHPVRINRLAVGVATSKLILDLHYSEVLSNTGTRAGEFQPPSWLISVSYTPTPAKALFKPCMTCCRSDIWFGWTGIFTQEFFELKLSGGSSCHGA